MSKKETEKKSMKVKLLIVGLILIALLAIVFIVVTHYDRNDPYVKGKINITINNNNVTKKLKYDLWKNEKKIIYMSKEDIQNFFDKYIYIDETNHQIITTYGEKVGVLPVNQNKIIINDAEVNVLSGAVQKDGIYYLPISSMEKVYNVNTEFIEKTQNLLLDSLDKKFIKADVAKNASVKIKTSTFSKTLDKLKKGDKVVCIGSIKDKWTKVRTQNGFVGYIKSNIIQNQVEVRSDIPKVQSKEKINLVWDYFSEYVTAPNRTGTSIEGVNVVSPSFFSLISKGNGTIKSNVGQNGLKYIEWAHTNNYKVWAMFSNNSYKETTEAILNSYPLRTKVINDIVSLAVQYGIDGINLDFENMNTADRDMFSRFVIELKPKLQEAGLILSVDVTTPDGGGSWSECYNRNLIGDVADYIVLMAYDQYSINSSKPGTTAGYNWVETNVRKMVEREEINSSKLILGIPLYTRLWATENDKVVVNKSINMKDINKTLPNNVIKEWKEDVRQYYAEYTKGTKIYKMWIEDEESIKAKLSLVKQYNLGGVASWEKDREPESIWNIIQQELN